MKWQLIIGCSAIAVSSFIAGFKFSVWTLKIVIEDEASKSRRSRRLRQIAEDDESYYR